MAVTEPTTAVDGATSSQVQSQDGYGCWFCSSENATENDGENDSMLEGGQPPASPPATCYVRNIPRILKRISCCMVPAWKMCLGCIGVSSIMFFFSWLVFAGSEHHSDRPNLHGALKMYDLSSVNVDNWQIKVITKARIITHALRETNKGFTTKAQFQALFPGAKVQSNCQVLTLERETSLGSVLNHTKSVYGSKSVVEESEVKSFRHGLVLRSRWYQESEGTKISLGYNSTVIPRWTRDKDRFFLLAFFRVNVSIRGLVWSQLNVTQKYGITLFLHSTDTYMDMACFLHDLDEGD